jgi:hypothetical protein
MSKKAKMPKHIGGIKIPKSIRKGPVGDFLNSSTGQAVLAQALLAAGDALAARYPDSSRDAMKDSQERLTYAFSEAVAAFKQALGGDAPEPRAGELDYESGEDEPNAIHLQ